VKCGECSEPICYPHLSPIEGVTYSEFFKRWELYHDGIFIELFRTKEEAAAKYEKIMRSQTEGSHEK